MLFCLVNEKKLDETQNNYLHLFVKMLYNPANLNPSNYKVKNPYYIDYDENGWTLSKLCFSCSMDLAYINDSN